MTQSGFTLLELVVVLVLLGVLAAVSIPAFSGDRQDDPAMAAASEVVSLLRAARARALARAEPVTLRIDRRSKTFALTAESGDSVGQIAHGNIPFPAGVGLAASTTSAVFRFAAGGGARGDTLIVRGGGPAVAVWADRWTGAPHVRQ